MKHFLLLILLGISLFSFSQNAPVAVDDTVYVQNIYILNQDTATINPNELTKNDTSLTGGFLRVDAIIYNGSNYVNPVYQNGNIYSLQIGTRKIGINNFEFIG